MMTSNDTEDLAARDITSQKTNEASLKDAEDASSNIPDSYVNLDEVSGPAPIENPGSTSIATGQESKGRNGPFQQRQKLPKSESHTSRFLARERQDRAENSPGSSGTPENYANLDELALPSPVENPREEHQYTHTSLEEERRREQEYEKDEQRQPESRRTSSHGAGGRDQHKDEKQQPPQVSKTATQFYTISYLVLFSFLGTLARLGLQTITFYPGAPVVFSEIWANFGGSLIMGFLSEDRKLFKHEWGVPTYHQQIVKARQQEKDEESGSPTRSMIDLAAAKKAHAATKKTLPLYIGLATGFCGCFTSFSTFIRDAFLAMSNELPTPLNHPSDYSPRISSTTSTVSRNGGYSFMALLAVIIITVTLSISALHIGAQFAIALEPFTPSIPFAIGRRLLDRIAAVLAWGCWLGAIFLAIFPPDRNNGGTEIWRGRAVFALVFAPLGCLGRFYASIYLNGKIASFPLGTFVVNIVGTIILAMSWDLQHVPLGGMVGCQVLQGIEDGFCGCLTTVSTWVAELSGLRRNHSYTYGAASVALALGFMTIIMGSMQWTIGFGQLQCTH